MNNKKWFFPKERPLQIGDFVVVETIGSKYTPMYAGIVVSEELMVTLYGLNVSLASVIKYTFVNIN